MIEINYSFIIPHKNSPNLLRKCIDSIPHRKDVQIIIVDDNSDNCIVDFNNFPGVEENCTEVYFTKEGKGAGYARNVGLSHAIGKWIIFADADDFFNPCLNEAMNDYVDDDSDVIFFKGNAVNLIDNTSATRGETYYNAVQVAYDTNDFSEVLILSTPCRKFFNRMFLVKNKIIFNETKWSNDVVFGARVAILQQKIKASIYEIYCVTVSDNSLLRTNTLQSKIVRFIEEARSVKIFRLRYKDYQSLYYWLLKTWLKIYKLNKVVAFFFLPYALWSGGLGFIKQIYISKYK